MDVSISKKKINRPFKKYPQMKIKVANKHRGTLEGLASTKNMEKRLTLLL